MSDNPDQTQVIDILVYFADSPDKSSPKAPPAYLAMVAQDAVVARVSGSVIARWSVVLKIGFNMPRGIWLALNRINDRGNGHTAPIVTSIPDHIIECFNTVI